jgi:hypothetical protein
MEADLLYIQNFNNHANHKSQNLLKPMSNGSSSSYVGACRKDIPYPSVSSESVPSLIDNLVTALYGEITKTVINRRVVWNIPCDPNNTAVVSPAFPRLAGEGLLCYIMRVFEAFISGGTEVFSPFLNWTFTGNGSTTIYSLPDATALLSAAYLVYIDGVVQAPVNYTIASGNPLTIVFSTAIPNGSQVVIVCMGSASNGTLDGVTINGATINTATINNLTATGTLALPVGSITSPMILNGTIINEDINASAAIATSKLAPVTATGSTAARTLENRFADVVNVKDFGAVGNGTTPDNVAISQSIANVAVIPKGTYKLGGTVNASSAGGALVGVNDVDLVYTANSGSGFSVTEESVRLVNINLDMGYSSGYPAASHGVRISSKPFASVTGCTITNFASDGASGGTGILALNESGRPSVVRISDCNVVGALTGSPSPTEAYGWILQDTDTSFVTNVFAKDIKTYAHELKDDSRHNLLSGLIAQNCQWALAYGQATVSEDGADFNVAGGIVGKQVAGGMIIGEGNNNLIYGLLYDPSGSPSAAISAVRLEKADNNAFFGVLSTGSATTVDVRSGSNNNYVQVAAMQSTGNVASFQSGVTGNVVEVAHSGNRNAIKNAINDLSGSGRSGATANVVICSATGEQYGSLSGTFVRSLSETDPSWLSSHKFRDIGDSDALHGYGTDGASGRIIGITHATPSAAARAGFWNQLGATVTDDFWTLRGWTGGGAKYVWKDTSYEPNTSNSVSLGSSAKLWSTVFAGTGAINTSDEREKQQIESIDSAVLAAWKKVNFKQFKFNDAVEKKGDSARIHIGVIAQQVKEAFESEGLDAFEYGLLCYDEWDETPELKDEEGNILQTYLAAGNRYGIRYEEALALECAYQRIATEELIKRIETLESK